MDNANIEWTNDMRRNLLVSMVKQVTEPTVNRAFITYEKTWSWLTTYEETWVFEDIIIYSGTRQINIQLCPVQSLLGEHKTVEYAKC